MDERPEATHAPLGERRKGRIASSTRRGIYVRSPVDGGVRYSFPRETTSCMRSIADQAAQTGRRRGPGRRSSRSNTWATLDGIPIGLLHGSQGALCVLGHPRQHPLTLGLLAPPAVGLLGGAGVVELEPVAERPGSVFVAASDRGGGTTTHRRHSGHLPAPGAEAA
jgi:hypothetical protein